MLRPPVAFERHVAAHHHHRAVTVLPSCARSPGDLVAHDFDIPGAGEVGDRDGLFLRERGRAANAITDERELLHTVQLTSMKARPNARMAPGANR